MTRQQSSSFQRDYGYYFFFLCHYKELAQNPCVELQKNRLPLNIKRYLSTSWKTSVNFLSLTMNKNVITWQGCCGRDDLSIGTTVRQVNIESRILLKITHIAEPSSPSPSTLCLAHRVQQHTALEQGLFLGNFTQSSLSVAFRRPSYQSNFSSKDTHHSSGIVGLE